MAKYLRYILFLLFVPVISIAHGSTSHSNDKNSAAYPASISVNSTCIKKPTGSIISAPTITSFSPASGAVGILVTINGTNLSSPTAFTIGGQSAIVVSNTGSVLVGMVMPGAVTGAVSLTTAGGAVTGSGSFTVTATGFPSSQQGAKLTDTTTAAYSADQGASVAVSADGNTAIVGGYGYNRYEGAAWVYIRSGGTWTQQGSELIGTGNSGFTYSGTSVALSADGNTAIVGGPADNFSKGAAWIYTRSGGVWTQQGPKLIGSGSVSTASTSVSQGYSVSLSADGNTAVVGAPGDNSSMGAFWVYSRSGAVWTQQGAKLVGTGNTGAAYQGLSVGISADGKTIVEGGYFDNSGQGAAWIFALTNGAWKQQGAKLIGTTNDNLPYYQGSAVSISADGNTAIIGGNYNNNGIGAGWVYTRNAGAWTQQGPMLAGTGNIGVPGPGVSVSVSADGNTAVIGSSGDEPLGTTWVYTRNNGAWTQRGSKLVGTGGVESGQGSSIALSADGNTAIVGGISDNIYRGAVWVFTIAPPATQASTVTFTNTSTTATSISWINGGGSARAVFIAGASSGAPVPVNGKTYNANTTFGSGTQIGTTGWYCVYNGIGSLVNITGLTAGTIYRAMVVEYNGAANNQQYLTNPGTGDPNNVATLSSDALLTSIKLTPASTLSVVTGPSYINYITTVAPTTSKITIIPTTQDATATIKVNGIIVASGTASQPIPLSVGSNVITIISTAQDGTTTKTYTITATKTVSSTASLANLKISSGTLTPAFATGTASYTASVANAISSVTITPTVTDATATIKVNGIAVASGSGSSAIPLVAGPNKISTVVTAQDGATTQTYTITVTRAPSTDALLTSIKLTPASTLTVVTGPGYVNYTTTVAATTGSITVTATEQDPTATIKVNGVTATSGTASAPIALTDGTNVINIVSTAQDGVTTKTYTITATKPQSANLSALKLSSGTLAPVFAAATTNYTASVTNATTSITVTPTTADGTATVTVNGITVASGTASGSIPLTVGANKIITVVTAQNGTTTQTYTVTVTRAASTDVLLTSIKLTPASTLKVVTGLSYVNYTTSVPNSTSSVTVTATEQDLTATITVNGVTTASGTASAPIALAVGSNTISIVSTAQDGVTTKTYTITATRAVAPVNSVYEPISVTKPADIVTIENDGITVHQGVSPNGDGINDFLTIDGISNYPDNSLRIIDKNGVMIYQTKGYDNNSKLFDGHSNVDGKMQLPGTYFYSLDYAVNGQSKHKTGFIILKY